MSAEAPGVHASTLDEAGWALQLARNAEDLLSVHDLQGDYVYASPAARRLLGYEPSELLGTNAYDHFHPEDASAILMSHQATPSQNLTTLVQYRIRRSDGSYVWFESRSRMVRSEVGEFIVVVSRDLSHRKPERAHYFGASQD